MATLNSNALCSLDDVKESLGLASSNTTKDNLIIRKINQASQMIENYCERSFKAADYTELLNGSGINEFVMKQRPINSVATVEYRSGGENVDSFYTMNSQYYFIDTTAGVLKLNFRGGGKWDAWRITYNAGYTTIPSDLAECCVDLAAYYVQNADGNVNVKSKQEGQRKIDYYQGISGFHNLLVQLGVDQTIDSYANWPLISE